MTTNQENAGKLAGAFRCCEEPLPGPLPERYNAGPIRRRLAGGELVVGQPNVDGVAPWVVGRRSTCAWCHGGSLAETGSFGKDLRSRTLGDTVSPMNTTSSPRTYVAQVIDTNRKLHTVRVESDTHQGVKAAARKIVKAQGFEVRNVESVFIA